MSLRAVLVLCLSLGCAVPPRVDQPGPAGAAPGPLVVAVVADQLAAWVAAERLPLLPVSGGFARLRREGTWVREVRYLHAATETAPGHASLFTGRTPREHGIVANAVLRTDLPGSPEASLLLDASTRLLGTARPEPGISLARLSGDTLADDLLRRAPSAVVVALSLKDRGVAFGAGRRPTWAAWYDDDGRGGAAFVTSSAYPPLPPWLTARAPDVGRTSPHVWSPRDPAFLERNATADDQPGEDAEVFGDRTFPHPVAGARGGGRRAFRATPMADELLVDLALEAVARERRPGAPMLVVLSLSALDYVGHVFGPDSREAWDALLRLDGTLARLLDGLDRAAGPLGWTVVLSADHGVASLPEVVASGPPPGCATATPDRWERPCRPGVRLSPEAVRDALDDALGGSKERRGRFVAAFVDPFLTLGPEGKAALVARREAVVGAVRDAARRIPGIAGVFPVEEGPCPPAADESPAALACRSARPGTGDFFVVPGPGSFFWVGDAGASHGSPWLYDRAVPLLVRGPGVTAGQVVERGLFGSYRATLWWALTGEAVDGPFGGPAR